MRDMAGREFDWFCLDGRGRIALFATGGSGRVPCEVWARAAMHEALGDTIEVIDWGSRDVWQSYVAIGLYVYDWDGVVGAYVRLAEPHVPVAPSFAEAVRGAHGLPRLELEFDQARVIYVA